MKDAFQESNFMMLGQCAVINDATYSPKEKWRFINYLDTGSITDNRISDIQHLVVGKDEIPSRARRKARQGDIVYSTVRPNQRHFGVIREVPENILVSTGFAVIRGQPDIACTEFIYWFLAQNHIVEHLHTIAEHSTSAYPSVRPDDIAKLNMPLPPLPEQRAIAHVLGTLDDKIDLNRRMNETLEEMARALFKSWFVDFDPVRAKMAGKDTSLPPEIAALFPERLVESELGDIPEGWEVRTLGEVASIVKGRSYKSADLNASDTALVTLKSFKRGGGYSPDGLKPYTGDYHPGQVLQPGEVVVAQTDVTQAAAVIGRAARVSEAPDYHTLVASLDLLIVRPHLPLTLPYVHGLLQSQAFHDHALSRVNGTTVLHLEKTATPDFRFALPEESIIRVFTDMASPLLVSADNNNQDSHNLTTQRDVVLPKLVSGEVRVGAA